MKTTLKNVCKSLFTVLILLAMAGLALPQQTSPLTASANGKGTMKVGQEEFEVHAVTVKLLEDGKAEIILVSEITFFIQGAWTQGDKSRNEVNLTITGTVVAGGAQGTGKLTLREDAKSIASLTLEGSSNTRKRVVKINFVAQ